MTTSQTFHQTPAGEWTDLLGVYLVVRSGNIGSGLMKKPQQGVNDIPILYYYNTIEYVLLIVGVLLLSWERELCNSTFCFFDAAHQTSQQVSKVFFQRLHIYFERCSFAFTSVVCCFVDSIVHQQHTHKSRCFCLLSVVQSWDTVTLCSLLVCTLAGGNVSCLDALSCCISCFPSCGEVKAPRVITWHTGDRRSEVVAAFLTTDVQFAK